MMEIYQPPPPFTAQLPGPLSNTITIILILANRFCQNAATC